MTHSEHELILKLLEDGFRGVNSRLDKVNGRLDNHGGRLGVIEQQASALKGSTNTGKWIMGLLGAGILADWFKAATK